MYRVCCPRMLAKLCPRMPYQGLTDVYRGCRLYSSINVRRILMFDTSAELPGSPAF
uniref:Uncharacterized protein n=1 Tax=Phaeodactylum tricornutum TaxID=2850 RepID=A0A8J9SYE0_PHATR